MTMDPSDRPAMADAAGRDDAADGLGDLYQPPAESDAGDAQPGDEISRGIGDEIPGEGGVPVTEGEVPGVSTGVDLGRPLGG
ncbi:MAG: hypothetical protein M3P48_06140 [Actinomycetota bacterium]|nr:hypothetical protein [Actinomycetota bacterium]